MENKTKLKHEKIERLKKKVAETLHRTRRWSIGATLLLCGLFTGGNSASAQPNSDNRSSSLKTGALSDMYAYASNSAKQNLPQFEAICREINKISLEEAAWNRTSYVFSAVVDSMNIKAAQAQEVWRKPQQKQKLVKDIMYTVTGQRKFAASCIATCNYSIFKTLDAMNDTTNIIPESGAAYGNAFLEDEQVKKYTVNVKPGVKALQRAIDENNIQPGDFILIPRNRTNYHTVMYVGKDDKGNCLYSGNNNPAVRKNIDYFNKQAIQWKRPSKIVKCNEMYKDQFLANMQQMENEGIAKEDILMYVYNTMGQGETVFNDILANLNKIQKLDKVTPFEFELKMLQEKPDIKMLALEGISTQKNKSQKKTADKNIIRQAALRQRGPRVS